MKALKLTALALAGLICAETAVAQTVMRLTGSTAFRKQTNQACRNVFDPGTMTYAFVGSANTEAVFERASRAIFKGQIGGQNVIIKTSFSGSTGGMQNVTQQNPIAYLPDTTVATQGGTNYMSSPVPINEAPQVTMGDTFQSLTPFRTPALDDTIVGVVAYGFVAGTGSPAAMTNITSLQAQALYVLGSIPASLFTGDTADASINIFALGRNSASGTRAAALSETGIGSNTQVFQWAPVVSGTTVTGQNPAGGDGNGGESSGGNLARFVRYTTFAGIGGYYVAYMGTGDAADAVGNEFPGTPARLLTYNGEAYSIPNVQQGKYSFWTYQHVLVLPTASAAVKNVANALASQIIVEDAEIPTNTMDVERAIDGGPIFPL